MPESPGAWKSKEWTHLDFSEMHFGLLTFMNCKMINR